MAQQFIVLCPLTFGCYMKQAHRNNQHTSCMHPCGLTQTHLCDPPHPQVKFDQKFDPGYQGAYGIVCEVESHPFEVDTMLFMDWRDDHTQPFADMKASNEALPTFLYAMPFSKNKCVGDASAEC